MNHSRLHELATEYDSGQFMLSDEELLTLVLCPVGDPSERMAQIARRILESGGLQGFARELANAPIGLTRFGLSREEVNHLTMAYTLLARCNLLSRMTRAQILSAGDAAKIVQPEMAHLDHEEMHVLVLNTRNRVVEYARPYKGTVDTTSVRIAEILRPAIIRNCPFIIVCHNHPSGETNSSDEDRTLTLGLVQASRMFDIELLDHLIIGNPGYTSLKQELRWE